jgi:hypothetical protein
MLHLEVYSDDCICGALKRPASGIELEATATYHSTNEAVEVPPDCLVTGQGCSDGQEIARSQS